MKIVFRTSDTNGSNELPASKVNASKFPASTAGLDSVDGNVLQQYRVRRPQA